jgi:hydroxymethylbilane synthase
MAALRGASPLIRLATRGSALALWQAHAVRDALLRVAPGETIELLLVRTQGDDSQESGRELARLGGTNLFTAEVDRAVAEDRADAGVHSLKDLGTALAAGLVLAAVLDRGPVEDVLVSRAGRLRDLPPGATIGTGSPRRRAMLLRARPDLRCANLRGNVETRIAKVERGDVEAAILARAGIARLGLDRAITEVLALDTFLPAVGQGLVGVTCRGADARLAALLRSARHAPSYAAGLAERALMARLGAGCHAPVGALGRVEGVRLTLHARVLSLDGASEVAGSIAGHVAEADRLGASLADDLLARGAAPLIAR